MPLLSILLRFIALSLLVVVSTALWAQTPSAPLPLQRPIQSPALDTRAPATGHVGSITVHATPVISTAQPLSAQQTLTLNKVSAAFNAMRDMQATFTQIEFDGVRTTGRFFLTKPGKVRFQYDRPSPLEIIADGSDLVVRDRKLNTQDFYPLKQTPLRYLLNEQIDLSKDTKVLALLQEPDLVTVVIEDKNDFSQGQLALFFDAKSLELRQWSVIDGAGRETAVAVQNVTLNRPNNPELFRILVLPKSGPQ